MGSSKTQYSRPTSRTIAYRLLTTLAAFSLVTAFGWFNPDSAQAQTASVTVTVVGADNSGSGVDGSLGSLGSQMAGRFGQYNSFRQLSVSNLSIGNGGAQSVGLPSGGSATITFQGMNGNAYQLHVSLPGGSTTVSSSPGGVFFVAGPGYGGGIIILAIRT